VTGAAGWGLLAQAAAETLVVRQADTGISWFTVLVGVAQIVIAIAILTFVLVTVVVGLAVLRKVREKGSILGQVLTDLIPLVRRMNRLAERLEAMTETAKASIDHVDHTVRDATSRVTQLLDGTERRVREFDALVGVARERADEAFVSSVATVRGVRAGARALRRNGRTSERASERAVGEAMPEDEQATEVLEERLEHAIDVSGELRAEEAASPRARRSRRRGAGAMQAPADQTPAEEDTDASTERPRIRPRA
jgi:uncharacterized protein YoxC